LEQTALMEKMEVKERQFQRHQQLRAQLAHKAHKAHKVRKARREKKEMQVHRVQLVLQDQLVRQVQLDRKDHQVVEAEERLDPQVQLVQLVQQG
jgi:hypothetical protein